MGANSPLMRRAIRFCATGGCVMPMQDFPKRIKRQLRELAGIAHEREVRSHLDSLYEQFASWKAGAIGTFDLTARIHEFHNGPDRKLFVHYNGSYSYLHVVGALVSGVLSEAEVPAEVLEAIAPLLAAIRSLPDRGVSEVSAETGPNLEGPRLSDE
jgi:hypothetical protein